MNRDAHQPLELIYEAHLFQEPITRSGRFTPLFLTDGVDGVAIHNNKAYLVVHRVGPELEDLSVFSQTEFATALRASYLSMKLEIAGVVYNRIVLHDSETPENGVGKRQYLPFGQDQLAASRNRLWPLAKSFNLAKTRPRLAKANDAACHQDGKTCPFYDFCVKGTLKNYRFKGGSPLSDEERADYLDVLLAKKVVPKNKMRQAIKP